MSVLHAIGSSSDFFTVATFCEDRKKYFFPDSFCLTEWQAALELPVNQLDFEKIVELYRFGSEVHVLRLRKHKLKREQRIRIIIIIIINNETSRNRIEID